MLHLSESASKPLKATQAMALPTATLSYVFGLSSWAFSFTQPIYLSVMQHSLSSEDRARFLFGLSIHSERLFLMMLVQPHTTSYKKSPAVKVAELCINLPLWARVSNIGRVLDYTKQI